jgi:hydrogenase expression/formation protein HypC
MCLGVPGRVERIDPNPLGISTGVVSFGGIRKEICLAYVPEANVGDYVLVHVGFAISTIDPVEAEAMFKILSELGDLEGLEAAAPEPGESPA